jgi:hypothetical protein
MKRLMFKKSDSDNDTKDGHMRSGKVFREVHLANLFMQNYVEEGFYSGEEADLIDGEHSEPTRTEEGQYEELRRGGLEGSETVQTIEVSTIILPVDSTLSNQSNPSHQSVQSTIHSSPPHIQSGTLGKSMADEMRLSIFREDGSEDPDYHWFL